jgi:hypothetical protein
MRIQSIFLGRLDLAQAHIAAVEIGDSAEARRQRGVLLERHRTDHADAAGARTTAREHGDGSTDR